jgi:hypothetical protein
MIQRCTNPNNPAYCYYGAKGIYVCNEWRNDFMEFFWWSITNGWGRPGLQIDRINNDGNYDPSNCRWVTYRENIWNRTCSSKYGVGISKRYNKFHVSINIDGTTVFVGSFYDLDSAIKYRNKTLIDNGELVPKVFTN